MSKKFKFILTLPEGIKFDSEIKSKKFYNGKKSMIPRPSKLKGVFDTYDEALEYAKNFKLYKYVLLTRNYDSYVSPIRKHHKRYFVTAEEAEIVAQKKLKIVKYDSKRKDCYGVYPTHYEINTVTKENSEEVIGYQYKLCFDNIIYYLSFEIFDTYEEAKTFAELNGDISVYPEELKEFYEITPIEILGIEIIEFEE